MVAVGGGGGGGDLDPLVTLGVVVVARGLLPRPVGVGHGVGSEVGVTQIAEVHMIVQHCAAVPFVGITDWLP